LLKVSKIIIYRLDFNDTMNRIVILLLAIIPVISAAQSRQAKEQLDSLLGAAKSAGEDTAAVWLYNSIAKLGKRIDPAVSLQYAKKELKLSQQIGFRRGEASAYNMLGGYYFFKSEYPSALSNYLGGLRIAEDITDKKIESDILANIGMVYRKQEKFAEALDNMFKSLKIHEEIQDDKQVAINLLSIGNTYMSMEKYSDAEQYLIKALALAEGKGYDDLIESIIGALGQDYIYLKNYPYALAYSFRALKLGEDVGNKYGMAISYGNIGMSYLAVYENAGKTQPDSFISADRNVNLSRAMQYLAQAVEASRAMQMNDALYNFLRGLSKAYYYSGNYKAAYENYEQFSEVKDSVYNESNSDRIAALETQRARELKDKDIQLAELEVAKKRNERWFFIAGIALLLGVMGVLLRSFRRQQKTNVLLGTEKKRSEDLLLNILPASVAEELKQNGGAEARQYDHVSVLFTDFVNFSGMAENMEPQQLVRELHECFSAFDVIIERNGLEKIKTIGDAYMAVCGLPAPNPEHARRTVQAAIDIRDFINTRRKEESAFDIRIGVNSGAVVAGIVGLKKFAFDIWGDAVNTAARMEQCSEPGKVNISKSTYDLVEGHFHFEFRGRIKAKNKGEVEMYFVNNNQHLTTPNRPNGHPPLKHAALMHFEQAKTYISNRLKKELPAHLLYHSTGHVQDVYDSAYAIAVEEQLPAGDIQLLLTAAMYHDSGFMIQSKDHERLSCEIAMANLPEFGYTPEQIETICGMIMATQVPQMPQNHLEQIICDADLDYLGRDDFYSIGSNLYKELQWYGVVKTEEEWDRLQVKFLEQHTYFTKTSIARRKPQKDKYLAELKKKLND
jgi:class 3 adenylate cyclase/predicted metal-dependent HD superfamily phosphohydrolase